MTSAIERIATERIRQVTEEGYTADSDDLLDAGDMAEAATAYAKFAIMQMGGWREVDSPPLNWPWDNDDFKPNPEDGGIRALEKAGALICAELDRLLRQKGLVNPDESDS